MAKMKNVTATEARQGFSTLLLNVKKEPVSITRDKKEIAVVVEATRYHELKRIEDLLYAQAAKLAIEEGFTTDSETKELIGSIKQL